MNILHALAPAAVGGLEQVVRELAAGTAARGHSVHVAATVDTLDHPFVACDVGGPMHPVVVPPRAYSAERRALIAAATACNAHVVHTHGYRSDIIAASAARHLGLPVVSTVHGFTGGTPRNRLYEYLQTLALRRHDTVVAVADHLKQRLIRAGVSAARIRVVPNATAAAVLLDRIDARDALGLPRHGSLIGWIGRLSREKGPDVFLNALARTHGEWHAAILGEGPDGPMLMKKAAALDLDRRLTWCGNVPDARRLFNAFDVVALSSRTEGTPIVLLEAMAAGVPIVATRVGGIPDLLPTDAARLVPPEQPAALAEAIRATLSQQNNARRRAGVAHARWLHHHHPDRWLDRYERLYFERTACATAYA